MPVEYLLVDVPCGVRKVQNYTFPLGHLIGILVQIQDTEGSTIVNSYSCFETLGHSLLQIREFLTGA
uniref:Uncharacterized protein n=1 Tax=Meloidogyne incognita TaxID=6306 RepID=A0A914KWH6_MELIC